MNIPAGTTILFQGGQIFYGSLYLTSSDGNNVTYPVTFSSYGTGKAIIRSGSNNGLYAYNTKGITVSNLIFEGSGMSTNAKDGILFYSNLSGNTKLGNIKITGVDVRNYGKTGISLSTWNGNTGYTNVLIDRVHVYNVKQNGIITSGYTAQNHVGWAHSNVIIRNTEVNNVPGYSDVTHRGSGIILGQVDNGTIENCNAHHNGAANTHCGGPGGIWVWDCNNVKVQYSESHHNSSGSGCDGLGFDLDGGVTNSTLQYNYSHDNAGAGYLLGQFDNARPWSNNIVRYNISENDGRTNAGGITLFKGAGTTMSGCKIYNNTIYVTPSATNVNVGAFTIIQWNTGIYGIQVYNNIFQTTGGASLIDIPSGYSATFKGNLYWSTGSTFKIKYQGKTHSSVSAWRTATGNEKNGTVNTGITADPKMQNAGYGGTTSPNPTTQLNAYRLTSGSPALNAGLNLSSLFAINTGGKDFFNSINLSGGAYDIGAHEMNGLLLRNMTLGEEETREDVPTVFYPNPVLSGSPLRVKGISLPYKLEVISITGALVWKKDNIEDRDFHIPTIDLAAGVYLMVTVDAEGREEVHKVVVQ
jgi:hypothetical protein